MDQQFDGRRLLALLALACSLLLQGCAALPSLEGRVASTALPPNPDTRIARTIAPLAKGKAQLSGVHALIDGRDAFAARMMMADAADQTLDVQYYIWRNDSTGLLLLEALRAAAERGVRVRLLLDDNNNPALDPALAALDAHPRAEVRLFNPFAFRHARVLGFLTDFKRLNRRMHNKSFTADGQATIVGGRNVGNEYYDAADDVLFADLDVLAVGAVVADVERDFDRYWNSRSAYPAQLLLARPGPDAALELAARQRRLAADPQALNYMRAMRGSDFVRQLMQRTLPLEWVKVTLVSDDPDKVLGASPEAGVAYQLPPMFGEPARQVDLVSPYFVPGLNWSARFGLLARNGIQVRILTNSLEATDVPAVHAGYARWRKMLLADGVRLLELKRTWPQSTEQRRALGGSSGSSLHAKTFAVDQQRMFVGSFNFDPRSADLNTEMGFVIDSPALAARMSQVLDTRIMERAYDVRLAADGSLEWHEQREKGTIVHTTEPGTSWWQRGTVRFMSLLPIEWML